MSLLVVGSMALDTVETPFGKKDNVLGGSASYFSIAASLFTDVKVVAVIGEDFPEQHLELLESKGVDLKGVEKVSDGKTFKWEGKYGYDLGDPDTLGTYLNVFEDFDPVLFDEYRECDYVFCANIDPEIQLSVLKQVNNPKLVALDSMNFWIESKLDELKEVIKHVDVLLINETETRQLAGEPIIAKAASNVLKMGPKVLIVKRGEHGVLMFWEDEVFWAPSFPLEEVFDPTGAGDTFAGGFMGYACKNNITNPSDFKKGVVYGSVIASFTVEDFSVNRLASVTTEELDKRFEEFLKLSRINQN